MSTTNTLRNPRHTYVIDAYERQLIERAIAYRLTHLPTDPTFTATDPVQTAAMIGETLTKALNGQLDRIGNVCATRTLWLWADHADIDEAQRAAAKETADRLFAARMETDRAIGE